MSRALTNLLLLKTGYAYIPYVALDEIIEETKAEYYLALRATQKNHKTDNENITPWVEYLLDVLIKQVEKARQLMESSRPEKLLSEKNNHIMSRLSLARGHLPQFGHTLGKIELIHLIIIHQL